MSYRDFSIEELSRRVKKAIELLSDCVVCAQECHVNRLKGERGFCRTGRYAVVSSWGPHFGEEEVLVGTHGSGTIFFAYCNMACRFCQNCKISHYGEGREMTPRELADIMLELQQIGCHNVNLVSPSHCVPQILEALELAVLDGLKIPLVYNTGGYDSVQTLKLLDGIIDIYMPDIKFGENEAGKLYASAPGYFTVAKRAVKEMYRQVGDLTIDERGLAIKGLIVRHLVLPNDLAQTKEVMKFLAEEISPNTFVNIMDQYYPAHKAWQYPALSRRITSNEYRRALEIAKASGLKRIYLKK